MQATNTYDRLLEEGNDRIKESVNEALEALAQRRSQLPVIEVEFIEEVEIN